MTTPIIQKTVQCGAVRFSNASPFVLIAGPCQLESHDHARKIAKELAAICGQLSIPLVFKSSFDKANRSSHQSQRGVGLDAGLEILGAIKDEFAIPVLTDVHDTQQCIAAAKIVDIVQIPAFLCRQTDLLLAAGESGCVVNVKKGQFLAPWDMQNVVDKIESTGCEKILLTERGASFGYNMLVSDFRALPIMARTGYPVIFDATHSVQLPGGLGSSSGGQREFVSPLARAAVAVGCGGLFIETHEAPDTAPSDGANMVPLSGMSALLSQVTAIDKQIKTGVVDG